MPLTLPIREAEVQMGASAVPAFFVQHMAQCVATLANACPMYTQLLRKVQHVLMLCQCTLPKHDACMQACPCSWTPTLASLHASIEHNRYELSIPGSLAAVVLLVTSSTW